MLSTRWLCTPAIVFLVSAVTGCGGDCLQFGGCNDESQYTASTDTNSASSAVFFKSGTGDTVFNLPSTVKFVTITGIYEGTSSNFIVRVAGDTKVNEILGSSRDSTSFSGTYAVEGGLVEITDSTGVSWTITSFIPS
jgi:hypothetical protein